MRRQRAGLACEKCRALKAKCDGRQPVCARCEGYGFDCVWPTRRRGAAGTTTRPGGLRLLAQAELQQDGPDRTESPAGTPQPTYVAMVGMYEALIQEVRGHLDSIQQGALDEGLRNIRRLASRGVRVQSTSRLEEETTASSPTYVGKASEVHFIHSIRQCVHGTDTSNTGDGIQAQSYSQTDVTDGLADLRYPLLVPSNTEAAQFLDVYLSTIHIAYPFPSKAILYEAFERFQNGDVQEPEFQPSLALFNFIFAIGSYYTSFLHGKHSVSRDHFRYYEQGLYYSRELRADCSLINIWALLVQCFFLLAVCHTDRCWNTLGMAIRMGQSIGLHVESPPSGSSKQPWMADRAHWRRTWYSMYNLDRLLALQLGRPMAIHEADFRVEMPAATDLSPFDPPGKGDAEQGQNKLSGRGCMMDYFVHVIHFSHIVGLVVRELYRPSQIDLSPDQMLYSASGLDRRLTEWKESLPRHLRFDLGHTFEKSISFRRQRNMLAVKFHHLRALIHRPFLCLPMLQMNNQLFMNLLLRNKERISEAESICLHEAQQTARLLHNVVDEAALVHDFPWWQMISCLICASSILFVAEGFYGHTNSLLDGRTMPQGLREDAETCLTVFEALSVNSAAAKQAANMLEGLSRMRRADVHAPTVLPTAEVDPNPLPSPYLTGDMSMLCEWPSEISSAMEWSTRFLDYPLVPPDSDLP
ncbi:hypothetical protein ASPZODRAFT_134476 [Penicilliopsis zonata CBS 506.65]|uniref:Zn(2)-C6 fungal-type domain-containing protein n=1 Tax=Penicilliopsis zonata CBS 506.65 TaxID=1073090 RepID=A0A1L9SD29_9EURO|nr:hypothetical protein ASPZODRAFT_134476 [Penicilliopsis zonata CBS 506.65]OJJ45048.1 hypothetical protein ASPZODRAFT_134476 [Penicilliopsis zonata CBS 506.65]